MNSFVIDKVEPGFKAKTNIRLILHQEILIERLIQHHAKLSHAMSVCQASKKTTRAIVCLVTNK